MRSEGSSFRNPFYKYITKYPVQFAQPVFFGQSPVAAYSATLKSGTGSLLRFTDKFVGVTCYHVLKRYRKQREADSATIFHFGEIQINPEQYIIAENVGLDLVTFDLTSFVDAVGQMTPDKFVDPIRWPPAALTTDDVIAFAGFPGIWREEASRGHLHFYYFSSGASPVEAIGDQHLVTRIEATQCVADIRDGFVLGSLGGLSGGPVFVWRTTPILFAELIGFAIEYQESLDLLYIRRATCLDGAGGILT